MEKEEFRLADALEAEKVWTYDGVAVLTASVCLPQLPGPLRHSRRFNRYYRRYCRAFVRYCEQALLPLAQTNYRNTADRSAPWNPLRVSLRCCGYRAVRFYDRMWKNVLFSWGYCTAFC